MNARKLLADHRETIIIVAVLLLLVGAFRIAPMVDPRIGFDGFSDVLYALVASTKMMICGYGAWYCKMLYHGDTPDSLMWQDGMNVETGAMWLNFVQGAFWVGLWFLALFVA